MQLTYLSKYLLINVLSFIFPFVLKKEEYKDWDLGVINNLIMTCKWFEYFFGKNQDLINIGNFDVKLMRWRYDSRRFLGKEMYFLDNTCLDRKYFFLEKYGEISNGKCPKQKIMVYPVEIKVIVDSLASGYTWGVTNDIKSKVFVNECKRIIYEKLSENDRIEIHIIKYVFYLGNVKFFIHYKRRDRSRTNFEHYHTTIDMKESMVVMCDDLCFAKVTTYNESIFKLTYESNTSGIKKILKKFGIGKDIPKNYQKFVLLLLVIIDKTSGHGHLESFLRF
jgi:hypothetical protein